MEKTDWYPGDIRPARRGVYERDVLRIPALGYFWPFSYWNGRRWGPGSLTPDTNKGARGTHVFQNLPWRGLTKEPK